MMRLRWVSQLLCALGAASMIGFLPCAAQEQRGADSGSQGGSIGGSIEPSPAEAPISRPAESRPSPRPSAMDQGGFFYVTGLDPNGDNWLALRASPSFQSRISSTRMGPGTRLTKLDERGQWTRVRLASGEEGWANSRFIACCRAAPISEADRARRNDFHYVDGLDPNGDNWLALRSSPSTRSGWSPTRMGPGTLLLKLGEQGEWLYVRLLSGEEGWANAKFVRCCRSAAPR